MSFSCETNDDAQHLAGKRDFAVKHFNSFTNSNEEDRSCFWQTTAGYLILSYFCKRSNRDFDIVS